MNEFDTVDQLPKLAAATAAGLLVLLVVVGGLALLGRYLFRMLDRNLFRNSRLWRSGKL